MTLLSIRGLYEADSSIFNALSLPANVDRSTVIGGILMECSELEVWLPDPDSFKEALSYWSRSRLSIWNKLYATTVLDYNPIWNKDGVIQETEERDLASTAESEITGQVSAYNSSAFQNAEKNISDASGTDTGTITRTRTEQGNIGITTTQQMIKEERDVSTFDIYGYIVRDFKERFCVLVY